MTDPRAEGGNRWMSDASVKPLTCAAVRNAGTVLV
jgi:hypothetical protein